MKKERIIEVFVYKINDVRCLYVCFRFPMPFGSILNMVAEFPQSSFSARKKLGPKLIERIVKSTLSMEYFNSSYFEFNLEEKLFVNCVTKIGSVMIDIDKIDILKEPVSNLVASYEERYSCKIDLSENIKCLRYLWLVYGIS